MGFFIVNSVPDPLVAEDLLETIGKRNFSLIYEMASKRSYLWLDDRNDNIINKLVVSIPGFEAENVAITVSKEKMNVFSIYRSSEENIDIFHNLYVIDAKSRLVILAFIAAEDKEVNIAKQYAETLLSSKNVRETKQNPGMQSAFGNSSSHRDIYKDTEEVLMAKNILFSINSALTKNNLLYKTFILCYDSDSEIEQHLRNRFMILAESKTNFDSFGQLADKLSKMRAFTFGTEYCSKLISFHGCRRARTIKTQIPNSTFGIPIGKLMVDGVSEGLLDICLEPSTLNLGSLITGLPGSGKTMEAMHISDRIINSKGCPSFIMAPTEEWNGFAVSHGMNLVRLFSDSLNISFFRCPPTAQKEKFYQDLSIILSSASAAGPYKRPMEKCMLNAFSRIYRSTSNPDPIDVYNEIEESIISLHGKRTNAGVKYTKHGENIKASLENLKIILKDPRYSTNNGLKFEELLVGGAVFDMSAASMATRSFLYALILNQIYALASNFDTLGDDKLRMFICIEEAQITFKEEDSPAVEDLKQRMQDFRKRGIGLMLLAHNVSDIDLGIRRLCQTRLYMKQAPDSAYLAAKELIFPGIEAEKIIEKLKLLDSRSSALSFVSRRGNEKLQEESSFIRTEAFVQPTVTYAKPLAAEESIDAEFELIFDDDFDNSSSTLGIRFLGETLHKFKTANIINKITLIPGRKYQICLINDKNKVTSETSILGKEKINIFVGNGKLLEIE